MLNNTTHLRDTVQFASISETVSSDFTIKLDPIEFALIGSEKTEGHREVIKVPNVFKDEPLSKELWNKTI